MTIGSDNGATPSIWFLKGEIFELIKCEGILSEPNIALIHTWLSRWL